MKKMTFLACATLLTSMVLVTSCNNKDQNEPQQQAEVVKTEFAISIPDNVAGGPLKMPSTTVQRDGKNQFQGITTITLIPFNVKGEILSTSTRLDKNINLNGDVEQADVNKDSRAKVYTDVKIPLKTASFLFYGKSAAAGTKFQVGSLIPDTASAKQPAAFSFSLEPVYPTYASTVTSGGKGFDLMAYLTTIANVSDNHEGNPKKWSDYVTASTTDSTAIGALYTKFIAMKGLSSFEVSRVLTDLYKTFKLQDTEIANAIKAAIANGDYVTTPIAADDTVRLIATYSNYPGEYGLPVGCVAMKWDGDNNKFIAQASYASVNMTTPDHFVYPAQLWYFANSQIQTSNSSKQDMYTNQSWADILAAHEDGDEVNARTVAVALADSIQYAVGRLDVQVKLKAGGTLVDNSETAEGVKIDVPYGTGFPVTAIFVGGQKNVGFDFTPGSYEGGVTDEYTIYDNVMTSTAEGTPAEMIAGGDAYSALNHTLVLETAASTKVRVAVEMKNTSGYDFYGYGDQLIPKNGKFYVIAELDGDAATATGKKVFKQDYTTTAKLTLQDLKKAYNTIPDLRTPQLEIGFSVDLSWKTGHEYVINFE